MRLTMKVAAAGETYMGRFPHVPVDITEFKTENGDLDLGRVCAELRKFEDFIQFSSDDNARTIAFTLEFLRQFWALLRIVDTSLPSGAATRPNTALALWGRARPAGHPAARIAA